MKNASWRGAVFMAFVHGTNAVYQGYISKFYQQRGARGQALSWLLVSFPLMSVVGQPVWGLLADRTGKRRRALRCVILLSIASAALLYAQGGYAGLLAACCAFGFCYPAIQPLGDSMILSTQKRNYGRIRLTGSLAYAFCSLAAGRLLKDDYAAVPSAVMAGLACLFAASFLTEGADAPAPARKRVSWRDIGRIPRIGPLLALFMLLQMTLGYFYSYYAVYFTALPGGTSGWLGVSLFAATLSEIPFLLLGDRLFRRFGAGRLLLLAAASLAARFALLGFCRGRTGVLLSQLLHGAGFIVMTFSMAKYISYAAPKELRATGQTMVSAAGGGFARTLGSLAGGYLSEKIGLRAGFACMALVSLAALLFFFPVYRRLPPLNGKT